MSIRVFTEQQLAEALSNVKSLHEMAPELIAASVFAAPPAAQVQGTPAAKWRADGEADPHAGRYDCERAKLPMGDMTDDELANAVFMHDHRSLDVQAILAGAPSSIALLTAAKDRIRWLSRKLESTLSAPPAAVPAELTNVRCMCGDEYPHDSYGAGFIAGFGMCENCAAAQGAMRDADRKAMDELKAMSFEELLKLSEGKAPPAAGVRGRCPVCEGRRMVYDSYAGDDYRCEHCDGSGSVEFLTQPAGVPEGWKLVPAVITSQMEDAYDQKCRADKAFDPGLYLPAYDALLAAAPTPPASEATRDALACAVLAWWDVHQFDTNDLGELRYTEEPDFVALSKGIPIPTPPASEQQQGKNPAELFGELYQVLGELDAPAAVLDQVLAAANGEPIPTESLLPFEFEEQRQAVAMPDKWSPSGYELGTYPEGWNDCLAEFLSLNPHLRPAAPADWCKTMERPKSQCGCPDCGSSLVQVSGLPAAPSQSVQGGIDVATDRFEGPVIDLALPPTVEFVGKKCQRQLMAEGKPYPRTCAACGLGGQCKSYPSESGAAGKARDV